MSGNGRDATVGGQEMWVRGYYGDAFSFSGDDDHLCIGGIRQLVADPPVL